MIIVFCSLRLFKKVKLFKLFKYGFNFDKFGSLLLSSLAMIIKFKLRYYNF